MLHLKGKRISRENLKNRKKVFTNSARLLFQHSISLFAGQGILIGIYVLVLTPFLSHLYRMALSITGYSYVTLNNIGFFLINPLVLLLLALLLMVLSIFLLLEACFLTTFFIRIEYSEKFRLFQVFLLSLKRLLLIFWRRNFVLIPMIWLVIALSNLPLLVFMVKRVRMLSFITESLKYKAIITPVLAVAVLFLLWVMVWRLFGFLYSLIEGKVHKKEISKKDKSTVKSETSNENDNDGHKEVVNKIKNNSDFETINEKNEIINEKNKIINEKNEIINETAKAKRKRSIRTILYFLVWNMGIGLFDLLIYLIIVIVTAFFIAGIPDKNLAIATFLSINDKMNGYLFTGLFAINTMANFALYTHLFCQYKMEIQVDAEEEDTVDNIIIHVGAYKTVVRILAILLSAVIFYSFYDIIRNGSPLDNMNLDLIRVTSHRGFSAGVPENTLPAIEKAIEEQADYVEIDVRMTKDGELVLLHDDSLKRTTGLNKKIWQLTYEEVSRLDAGSWKDKAYTGTKIPTLREVFELCKGKVNLNLDLKYRNEGEDLEEKVAALIEEYEMQWQCVISSTSLAALENIKQINPDIRTGYITYQIYRGYFYNDSIDFFSVRSNLVTKTVSSEVHKAGKEIHVWTVNARRELERMKLVGVDNVITDDPSYAKGILYEEESSRFLITLIKIVMG